MLSENEIEQIRELVAATSQEELSRSHWDKESHDTTAEVFRGCLDYSADTKCHLVLAGEEGKEDFKFIAVTGNGPTSEANAAFFSLARRIVVALLKERAELIQEINELHLK